ncbi:hypothetical protein [Undibacter mobilis]|nr:hypothetical protein [Undibacter mobilis]
MSLGRNALLAVLMAPVLAAPAHADRAAVEQAAYADLSISAPTAQFMTVCHGFGCQYRVELGFSLTDQATLRRLMAAGKASAASERKAVAAVGAWFDKRIAPLAGTAGHVARANRDYMFDKGQFDCIDTSRNITSLLLVLDELGLLKYHVVAEPEARGHIIDFNAPHATAVLVEKGSGVKWSVDAWTRSYGQAPEVMPLDRWKELD